MTGPKLRGEGRVVERNLDGDALHDLGVIAGGVVRREQGELRAAGGSDLDDFAGEGFFGVHVEANFGGVADLHIGELGLLVIRLHPLGVGDEGDCLRAG